MVTFHEPAQHLDLDFQRIDSGGAVELRVSDSGDSRLDFLLEQVKALLNILFFHAFLPLSPRWACSCGDTFGRETLQREHDYSSCMSKPDAAVRLGAADHLNLLHRHPVRGRGGI
jgi:hypothetical protein